MTRIDRLPSPGQSGTSRSSTMTERDLQRQVVQFARQCGWDLVFHAPSVVTMHERGWPDLVLVRRKDRRLIFAELKAEKGKLSERQAEVLDILGSVAHDSGQGFISQYAASVSRAVSGTPRVQVVVWRPSDWDRIVEALR